MNTSVFFDLRQQYHKNIFENILGYRSTTGGGLTVADSANKLSKDIAERVARKIGLPLCPQPPEGQTAGSRFTEYTKEFLETSFNRLQHIRPGSWHFSTNQASSGIASFDQYEHLSLLKADKLLQTAGNIQKLEQSKTSPELQNIIQSYKDLTAALASTGL
ncbi:MAG TPA: NgoMIV family type II restriction endonuclease [Chloroflexia bacterium]|nr:NgoMIV family type II restriction endonuclease [Chloroflexia bacterium]